MSFCQVSITELYFDDKRDTRKHGPYLVYDTENRPFEVPVLEEEPPIAYPVSGTSDSKNFRVGEHPYLQTTD